MQLGCFILLVLAGGYFFCGALSNGESVGVAGGAAVLVIFVLILFVGGMKGGK